MGGRLRAADSEPAQRATGVGENSSLLAREEGTLSMLRRLSPVDDQRVGTEPRAAPTDVVGSPRGRNPRSRRHAGLRSGRGGAGRADLPRSLGGTGVRDDGGGDAAGDDEHERVSPRDRADGPGVVPDYLLLRALADGARDDAGGEGSRHRRGVGGRHHIRVPADEAGAGGPAH
jgi:hypothetical protein